MRPPLYSDAVRAMFAEARHAGALEGAVSARRDDQGVRVQLFAQPGADGLAELGFLAWGCPHLLAATEAFCREYTGKADSSLADFTATEVMQSLGIPIQKTARIIVLEDAVHALGAMLANRPKG